jgi:hypothetical protein
MGIGSIPLGFGLLVKVEVLVLLREFKIYGLYKCLIVLETIKY